MFKDMAQPASPVLHRRFRLIGLGHTSAAMQATPSKDARVIISLVGVLTATEVQKKEKGLL
jgi:hypothetical protein